MSRLLSEIHFWTTQEDVITKNSYYGAFKYYSKKELGDSFSKKNYCDKKGILWNPVNRRQNKLKDRLKELEDSLVQNKVINYLWANNNLQLLLSTGSIVYIKINEQTGDIAHISFDKQLSTKLQVNIICDGIILGPQVICICNDGHVLGHGGAWKDGWLLEGSPRRRVHSYAEWLVVWGRPGTEHPQPWSPLAKDHQRANLHLYWLGLRGPELLAHKNTDGEPFIVKVSNIFQQTIILIEQKVTQRGSVSVELSTLELLGNSLKTVAITAVPLQTQVSCCELSSNEEYLLICCIDSTIALLDRNRGSTKSIRAGFIPTLCVWQRLGALVAICNEKGQIQYYDIALNSVRNQITSEEEVASNLLDLSSYFHSQVSVVSLNWDHDHMIVVFEQGPLVCVTHVPKSLSFISLAKSYIHMCEMKKAIALILSWNFGDDSFSILQMIVSFLLKKPMTEEISQMLQDALGCYHGSSVPLSSEIRSQFGNQVFSLTRRYFHQLIRAGMYETAFLLAVDVVHHDLFMDLHYVAVKIGETEMAAAARAQASALVSRCSSEISNCSNSSCSECSISDEENKEKLRNEKSPNDNLISTNFNQPEIPKTYIVPSGAYEFPKLTPPRVNYVKPPQVPANFNKPTTPNVPPLPFNFSVPNLLNSNLGIPLTSSLEYQNNKSLFCPSPPTNFMKNISSLKQPILNCSNVDFVPHYGENSKTPATYYDEKLQFKISSRNNHESSVPFRNVRPQAPAVKFQSNFTRNIQPKTGRRLPTRPILTPPLPITTTSSNAIPFFPPTTTISQSKIDPVPTTFSSTMKKPQTKVKFSDTVTAFIVPEVKRPLRVAPPPHITDPQRELADSLPLCHPNEDYLKDFAPIRTNETEDAEKEHPKIKVVHFGVV